MIPTALAAALVAGLLAGVVTIGNEWSQGDVANAMGFGHHHMAHDPVPHCARGHSGSACQPMMHDPGAP